MLRVEKGEDFPLQFMIVQLLISWKKMRKCLEIVCFSNEKKERKIRSQI